jgi:hypothetical protein
MKLKALFDIVPRGKCLIVHLLSNPETVAPGFVIPHSPTPIWIRSIPLLRPGFTSRNRKKDCWLSMLERLIHTIKTLPVKLDYIVLCEACDVLVT